MQEVQEDFFKVLKFINKDKVVHDILAQTQKEDGGELQTIRNLNGIKVWMASTTPRPLYPRVRTGAHCAGG